MNKLYILMRTDMRSMTVGRAAAQAAHAQSSFIKYCFYKNLHNEYNNWLCNGVFGTVIVLGVDKTELEDSITKITHGNIVRDPEYIIKDGQVEHILYNIITCGWVFPSEEEEKVLESLELYKGSK